jgi:hypothetical protein
LRGLRYLLLICSILACRAAAWIGFGPAKLNDQPAAAQLSLTNRQVR